jgi:periplasmic divalent cation tolerance protein
MMHIAWTTVPEKADAARLATETVSRGLACCAQVDGPVTSTFVWKGQLDSCLEFRIQFKCLPEKLNQLEAFVLAHHPYQTPEWTVINADRVSEKYLSWARADSTNRPL